LELELGLYIKNELAMWSHSYRENIETMPEVPEVGTTTIDYSLILKCFQQATYEAVIAALEEMRNLADLALCRRPIDRKWYAPFT
jgi:hypothetical protein